MNYFRINRRKELTLFLTSFISLILAYSLNAISIEYKRISILLLLIFYFGLFYYLSLTIIEEKNKLLKATLMLYTAYVFSFVCRLLSYLFDGDFIFEGVVIGLANILRFLYWPAMFMIIISLFYSMKYKNVTAKILFTFCGIFLAIHLLKSYLRIDLFLNSIDLNENIFLFLSVPILGFTMQISKDNMSYGLKGILTILFMMSTYILIKAVMITTES